MSYSVLILPSALKSLNKLPEPVKKLIDKKINSLSENPRPHGCKKLIADDAWRVRIGDYRVIYEINDQKITVIIVKIGNRKEVYR
jgi:Cytotoxic translational repressor of toxin-antitoxin stability system